MQSPKLLNNGWEQKVLKLESKKHGSYQLETTDAKGNVVFQANGVIHEFSPEPENHTDI